MISYVKSVAGIIAKAQITNGGPVILLQPENEYTQAAPGIEFPSGQYFYDVEQQYRQAGIVIPIISNDAGPEGHEAPGTGLGSVDIYGHDSYPLQVSIELSQNGFNYSLCASWMVFDTNRLPSV